MENLLYKEIKKISIDEIDIFQYRLLEQCDSEALPKGRYPTHLVAKKQGEVLWIYNPIDPKSGKIFNIWHLEENKKILRIGTDVTDYGYHYYIRLNPLTGEVVDTYLTK
jgi:hypothetical protein